MSLKETFELAIKNHQNNKLEAAKNLYNEILKINPTHMGALNNLGLVFQRLGEYQKALNCYEKAIEIDPNYKEALNNIGAVFKELGEYQKAMGFYEKLIEIDPNYKDALNNIGAVFKELGEYQKAMRFYEKAIEIDPNFTHAHFNRGVLLYEIGKYENAMEVLKLINFKNSNSYLLSCLFKLDKLSVFQEVLDEKIKIKESNNIDAMIGSSCSRSQIKYGINIPNPFCNDPLSYVLNRDLTKVCNFNNIFVKTVKNILDKNNIPLKNQGLLTNGIQTSGNFFNYEVELTSKIKDIIYSEVENYKANFANSEEGFLKKFPRRYTLNAWLVSMKSGGKLNAHMHENGWLSGSIYINVPKKIKVDSGNLVVCIEEDYGKEKNKNIKKSINVVTGNICLFPASLLHYTVPFESKEERIVLAFDVIAKN